MKYRLVQAGTIAGVLLLLAGGGLIVREGIGNAFPGPTTAAAPALMNKGGEWVEIDEHELAAWRLGNRVGGALRGDQMMRLLGAGRCSARVSPLVPDGERGPEWCFPQGRALDENDQEGATP